MSELNDDDKWIVSRQSAHSDGERNIIHYLHLNLSLRRSGVYRGWAADEYSASN